MKVGDYVRTKGCITKIDSCTCWKAKNQWYISYKLPDGSEWASAVTDEFKISPNIIDLIEVGDYVNQKRVEWIGYKMYQDNGKECKGIGDKIILFNGFTKDYISEKDIKSIVTKEQFESMEYKVGE